MRNFKILFLLLMIAVPAYAAKIKNGEELINAMHKKYSGKWYKTLTFVQKNTTYKPDGAIENSVWNEALSLPGKLRADFEPLSTNSGVLFADGKQHTFKDGKLTGSRPIVHSLLVLGFDVYAQPVEKTISQLKELKIDLSVLREDEWQGRSVYVVGAQKDDARAPQFWIDKKNLYFVRLLQPAGKDKTRVQETQFNKYRRAGGGWISPEVVFMLDGKRTFMEEYTQIRTGVALEDNLFDTESWMTANRNYFKQ